MKAIYINETGGTDVLTYGDRPEPEIAPGEILIRVGGSALNHLDLNLRAGNCRRFSAHPGLRPGRRGGADQPRRRHRPESRRPGAGGQPGEVRRHQPV